MLHALQNSGLEFTIIANGLFLEYVFSPFFGFDVKNRKATLYGTKDSTISFTSLDAVSEFTAESINNPASKYAYLTIAGETKNCGQIVEIVERATGKSWQVEYRNPSELQSKIDSNSN